MGRQLFLIDPIGRLRPEKDSSVALMQAGQRAGEEIWAAQPSDLAAGEGGPRVLAAPITVASALCSLSTLIKSASRIPSLQYELSFSEILVWGVIG